jgi:uncharacterized protein YbjQ (UPF0145 family)
MIVTTTNDISGHKISKYIGVVRGITVRSRSAIGTFGAGLQSFFGGNITLFTDLAEEARQEAYDLMIKHAQEHGANAVIGMRYDANEMADGITEVLAHGTAVVIDAGSSRMSEAKSGTALRHRVMQRPCGEGRFNRHRLIPDFAPLIR